MSFVLKNVCGYGKDVPFKTEVVLGRSRKTGIKDPRLSRQHLRLKVVNDAKIHVIHVGNNHSVINDQVSKRGFCKILKPNCTLELLEGKFKYQVVNSSMASGGHWSKGLVSSMSDPDSVVFENDELCVIKDKYPKAETHLLVLPKDESLNTLKSLNQTHAELIERMIEAGEAQVPKNVEFRTGFHAIPSMQRLHLHVISQDFNSSCLKNKKHWNSFNTPYFVPAHQILAELRQEGKVKVMSSEEGNRYLKTSQTMLEKATSILLL